MQSKYFAIYDQAASAFIDPFYLPTTAMAEREFKQASNDEKTKFFHHPSDFTLFELGEWDNQKGKHVDHEVGINLGSALQFQSVVPLREAEE